MDLKETIISSFFSHLILFLLMIAVSNSLIGLPSNMKNSISVDLPEREDIDRPAAINTISDQAIADPVLAADNPASPDVMANDHKEDPTPEVSPETKPESGSRTSMPDKSEATQDAAERFTSLEAYHQFIMLHKKIFKHQAGNSVRRLLGEALRINKRVFYGGTAIVNLQFGTDGRLKEVVIDSGSQDLKAFLGEIDWGFIPAPSAFSLGQSVVQIEFTVMEGYMNFNFISL